MPRVAVIILMWNSEKHLPGLLFSLKKTTMPEGGVSFLFVDNASTDGSAECVWKNFPEAIVIKNEHNLGFAGGNNVGVRHPSVGAAEYIALLNHDTVVDAHWLVELVRALGAHTRAASAQSLLLYEQEREKINSAGNEIHFLGFGYSRYNGKPISVISSEQRESRNPSMRKGSLDTARDDRAAGICTVTYASGAAVLYRRKMFEEIGFFDEDLFMYHEDLDVGWKFLLKGYKNILVPTSIVYHHYEFSRSIQKYYWQERNRLLLLLTHYKVGTILLILPALLVLEIGLTFYSFVRGFFHSRVQAYRWIFTHIPTILRKRKFVQKLRTQPDSEVLAHFIGIITDQEVSNPVVIYLMNPIFSAYSALLRKIVRW